MIFSVPNRRRRRIPRIFNSTKCGAFGSNLNCSNDYWIAQAGYGGGRRAGHPGAVVKRFGYWRDALCLGGCGLYALNRWVVAPRVDSAFLHGYFNDTLLIPCALPLFLQLQRRLGLRQHDEPPRLGEIAFHLVVWSVLFEWIGPHLMQTVGDPLDVLAYTVGAVLAGGWWHRDKIIQSCR